MANLVPPVAGFPRCAKCPYVRTAAPALCLQCVLAASQRVGPHSCPVCQQTLAGPDVGCRNALCLDQARSIDCIHALAVYSDPLRQIIWRLKDGETSWAMIFGRLVIGWLEQRAQTQTYSLVLHNPGYTAGGGVRGRHTEAVMYYARVEDTLGRFPIIDPANPLLVLTTDPPKSKGGNYQAKQQSAAARYAALTLTRPADVGGASVLVYDDICTTGAQLDAVARFLKAHGATHVEGLVLARTAWGP